MNRSIVFGIIAILIIAGASYLVYQSQFQNEAEMPENEETASVDGCYIGGCSGQICSDEPGMASSCEYKEEYACYQGATCERQASGRCGWTQTAELVTCLEVVLEGGPDLK